MNKGFLILVMGLSGFVSYAQDDIDAMRYSQTSFYGDARFTAMAGSFGALGANVSCMNFNPAGIALYRKGEFVFTPGLKMQTVNTNHYGTSTSDVYGKLNISNIGFVTAWDSKNLYPPSSKQYADFNQRNAFGISYNRLADFNSSTSIEGYPGNSSIINDFVNSAQGYYPKDLNQSYEWLAYQTYLINPQSSSDTNHYWGMMLPNTPLKQTKTIKQTNSRMGELGFSFAHAFEDKLYVGATLGVPIVKYNRVATYEESDYKSQVWPFKSLKYEEQLATTGSGFNLKLGVIYRAAESVRLGAYVHTPTSLSLTDNYAYNLSASYDTAITSAGADYTQGSSGSFRYRIVTPARAGGSVCYIYNKILAVNVDAEYINYASAKLKDSDHYLDGATRTIAKKYSSTMNLRVGAELNIKPVIIRAGFASYGSPFGPSLAGKFVRNTFTGGVGFRGVKNMYFDLGFMYTQWQEDYYLYSAQFVSPTQVSNSVLYLTATLGVKFN